MMYKPHRDERFEYVYEAMEHIEARQCVSCARREPDGDYFMCGPVSASFLLEMPIAEVEDLGDKGLRCTAYEVYAQEPQ